MRSDPFATAPATMTPVPSTTPAPRARKRSRAPVPGRATLPRGFSHPAPPDPIPTIPRMEIQNGPGDPPAVRGPRYCLVCGDECFVTVDGRSECHRGEISDTRPAKLTDPIAHLLSHRGAILPKAPKPPPVPLNPNLNPNPNLSVSPPDDFARIRNRSRLL